MRISRLDLYGFKSFPDRTTFHFGRGVSCVVGPNGSGKSNVVDALRWCIGEQSPKSLRGSEMSDVIFAGSEDRRPVGFAEVQLTLIVDGGEPFPGDYAALPEVSVGRRLHRTGASEYLINQNKVRRRDVVELLLDSGVGNNLYSFIEQGQVDKVITASPEERRTVIDEAAGIARYKTRRAEAHSRLEDTATQLDRASDVVDEMDRRLQTLQRQVERAAEFRRRRTRIRHAELELALTKVHSLTSERRDLRDQQRNIHGKASVQREELEQRAEDIEARRAEIDLVQAAVGTQRDRLAELDARIREQEATRRLHEQRRGELLAEVERARTDLERAQADRKVAEEESEAVAEARESLEIESRGVESQAETLRAAFEAARAAAVAARTAAVDAEEVLQELVRRRMQDETSRASLDARLEALDQRAVQLQSQVATLQAQSEAAQTAEAEARDRCGPARAALVEAQAARLSVDAAWSQAQQAQQEADAALGDALKERQRRWDAQQAEVEAIRRRGRIWADAADVTGQQTLDALESRWGRTLQNAEAEGSQEADRRAAVARDQAQLEAQDTIERLEAELEATRGASGRAEAAVSEAREEQEAAEEESRALAKRQAEVEGRLAGVTARLKAEDPALQGIPSLLDGTPQPDRPAVLDRLGDRALRPMVRDSAVLVEAMGRVAAGGSLQAWYRPAADLPEAARAPWMPTLHAALGHVGAGHGPAAGPGFRVTADGWVEIGSAGDLSAIAEQQETLSNDLHEMRRRALDLEGVADLAAIAFDEARDDRATAEEALRVLQARVEAERGAALRAVADAEAAAREEARRAVQDRQASLVASRQREVEAARSRRAVELAAVRTGVEDIAQRLIAGLSPVEDDTSVEGIEARAAVARQAATDALAARDVAREAVTEAARIVERAESALEGATRERQRLELELQARSAESAAISGDRGVAQGELEVLLVELNHSAGAEEEAQEEVATHRVDAAVASRDEEQASAQVAEVEQLRSRIREDEARQSARWEGLEQRRQAAHDAIARAETRAREAQEASALAVTARDEAGVQVEEATADRAVTFDELEQQRARLKRLRTALDEAERTQDQMRARVERIASQGEGLERRLREIQTEVEVIAQRMDDRYQASIHVLLDQLYRHGRLVLAVDPEVAEGLVIGDRTIPGVDPVVLTPDSLVDEARVVEAVRGLEEDRGHLASLGEVNLAALEEYRELAERFQEMATQREDLEESMRSIKSAIGKMNRICRERFRDAFDRVKEYFQETYPRLVGGGSARLALTNEEDLLESGVEIFVQPPGKRLQNLGLLSGGEKAMTAIALLIALFRVKPSPFCVLDEVDAPLDEANGARFNEMLREMASLSQFLVITHNRKTMECADTLYGITMAKPGVSRLVSVRMG